MRAAAPPPTALKSDTSCGIAVIFTVRALYRPAPPPMTIPTTMIAQPTPLMPLPSALGRTSSRIAVAAIAIAMPAADSRFPFRAVAGEFIRISPRTNADAPASQASRTRIETVSKSIGQPSTCSDGLGATGFLLNIWSIRSVTT